ncbi:MAG: signal peptidase I [Lachnospiraceae bacterium]
MKKGKKIMEVLGFLAVLFVILAGIIRMVFVIQVTGNSMNPGLKDGEYVFAVPVKEIQRGDIIVTRKNIAYGQSVIKRVIAMEGDTVEIDITTGDVTVNGERLEEPYIAQPTAVSGDIDYPFTVPKDCVFLLGDNRNHSIDSRFQEVGCVPMVQVERKIMKK